VAGAVAVTSAAEAGVAAGVADAPVEIAISATVVTANFAANAAIGNSAANANSAIVATGIFVTAGIVTTVVEAAGNVTAASDISIRTEGVIPRFCPSPLSTDVQLGPSVHLRPFPQNFHVF
jgi:hypothetical protein